MSHRLHCLVALSLAFLAGSASAATLTIATGSSGRELEVLRQELDQFTQRTGIDVAIASTANSPLSDAAQFQRWLAARNASIDVYRTDITWAPQLARHFIDLGPEVGDIAAAEIPEMIRAQTIAGGKLVALPYSADLPALFYREDLLAKYRLPVPTSWEELARTAGTIMAGERTAGDAEMWGYVFPGAVSEALTANALEWIASNDGGSIVEADGTITIDNVKAILAVEAAETWVGTVTPRGVVDFTTADARALWLGGHAVFARDWHDMLNLSRAADSPTRDDVAIAKLPLGKQNGKHAATIGGWSLAVSRYTTHRDEAISLVRFLASAEAQRTYEVGALGHLPAIVALYDDGAVAKTEPEIQTYKQILGDLVVRPAAQTGEAYGRVSLDFARSINRSLRQDAYAEDFLQSYRHELEAMARAGWSPAVPRGQTGDSSP